MIRYIAFLRAVNVSGHRIIKMEYLREIFVMPGIKDVVTYIQSGNVLFNSKETDTAKLTQKIEKQLHKSLGYEVEAFVRSIEEIETIIKNNPFKKAELSKALKLYVSFLAATPTKEQVAAIESINNDLETIKVIGREVYALIRKDTTEKLKYSNMLIEKKLKMLATSRDWNTINKILSL